MPILQIIWTYDFIVAGAKKFEEFPPLANYKIETAFTNSKRSIDIEADSSILYNAGAMAANITKIKIELDSQKCIVGSKQLKIKRNINIPGINRKLNTKASC